MTVTVTVTQRYDLVYILSAPQRHCHCHLIKRFTLKYEADTFILHYLVFELAIAPLFFTAI